MNQLTDPLDHIRAYAPPLDVEPPADQLLDRAFASPPPGRGPSRHRAKVTIAGTAVAVAVAGFGTAAAAGTGPVQLWNKVFGTTAPATSRYQADPSTAQKVFAVPGPGGQEFAAWTVSNDVGWRCIATFFERAGTAQAPAALTDGDSGHSCILAKPPAPTLFGDGDGGSTPGSTDRLNFVWEAGDAVRAELQVSNGSTFPVAVRNGWLGGWFTRDQVPLGVTATIVAYGADGAVLGRFTAIDQFGCDDPEGC